MFAGICWLYLSIGGIYIMMSRTVVLLLKRSTIMARQHQAELHKLNKEADEIRKEAEPSRVQLAVPFEEAAGAVLPVGAAACGCWVALLCLRLSTDFDHFPPRETAEIQRNGSLWAHFTSSKMVGEDSWRSYRHNPSLRSSP